MTIYEIMPNLVRYYFITLFRKEQSESLSATPHDERTYLGSLITCYNKRNDSSGQGNEDLQQKLGASA